MPHIQRVHVQPRSLERFAPICGQDVVEEVLQRAALVSKRLGSRVVWNVNSTAAGGGVAEMLNSLLGYPLEYRIDVRWAVIEGTPEFFAVTKRLHHALQGSAGDGSRLGPDQRAVYDEVLKENARELGRIVRPGDIVILHDPQTTGLAPYLQELGCLLIWRCHIGLDQPNAESELGWAFLAPYLQSVPVSVFSRHTYVPSRFRGNSAVVAPSIDPFSPKSEDLDELTVRAVLQSSGLVTGGRDDRPFEFATAEGHLRRVERQAQVIGADTSLDWESPLVLQVSRWDPLKDPIGVMDAFSRVPFEGAAASAHLLLVGPEITGVADDPEAGAVVEATLAHWHTLPERVRGRVHLVLLPTADAIENSTMVNALQSHARVVVQKSLQEGFGLTVTEAMWKARPIVASRVGGIQDQIEDRVEGLLLPDPTDPDAAARAITTLLEDDGLSERLGAAARRRVIDDFLPPRHLLQYASLIEQTLTTAA